MRHGLAGLILVGLVASGLWLHEHEDFGRRVAFLLIAGALFGWFLQRSRFCFFCILRDLFENGDGRPALGILAALAAGTVGYLVVFGAWVPDPGAGYLPPNAHIGPASWVLVAGGLSFGIGMSLSGSCISAHLYRLGEGSLTSIFALAGTVAGFLLGYQVWNRLWVTTIATADPVWLPARFGYSGSLALQFAALGLMALVLLRRVAPKAAEAGRPVNLGEIWQAVMVRRWPTWLGGTGIGILGAFAYLRTGPLGVTAEINRLSRNLGDRWGLAPDRLEGLDRLAGCIVTEAAAWIGENGIFVLALIAASLAAALAAGQFRPERKSLSAVLLALAGGVLLGFGAMISLGCSIGTLLSGISALAVSGWIFGAAMVAGVWASLPLRRRLLSE